MTIKYHNDGKEKEQSHEFWYESSIATPDFHSGTEGMSYGATREEAEDNMVRLLRTIQADLDRHLSEIDQGIIARVDAKQITG